MSEQLTKKQNDQARFIASLVIVSALLQSIAEQTGQTSDNPAISECVKHIDTMLAGADDETRTKIIRKVQTLRIRISKKVSKLDVGSGIVGALEYLTTTFKAPPASSSAFIIDNFRRNLETIKSGVPYRDSDRKKFIAVMKEVLS
jgi:hypothetical protein